MVLGRTGQDRSTQLLHGVLDMCLLSVIEEEASYGYEMVRKLRDRGLHLAGDGSIYPLQSRLQKQGLIEGVLPDVETGSCGTRAVAAGLGGVPELGRRGPRRRVLWIGQAS
jgi:PadR family transcriptional regulator PadR